MVLQKVGEAGRVQGAGLAGESEARALGQRVALAAGLWRSEGPAAQGAGTCLFFNNAKMNVFLPLWRLKNIFTG